MICENFEDVLNAELDNLLSPAERQELIKHLQSCRNCRNSAQGYRQLKELLAQIEPAEVPKGFTEMVMARIRALPAYSQNQDHQSAFGFSLGLAMVASVAALFFLFSDSQVSREAPQLAKRPAVEENISNPFNSRQGTTTADFQLVSARGKVQVMSTVGFIWSDVSDDMVLKFGDKVRTLSDSKVHLRYSDNTRLKLSSNTLVQVESNGVRVFQGDSWVKVVKKGRVFQTWTPNLVASVRGTIYDVSVRTIQRSYEDFLKEITRKNIGKGISPEAYFQEFSLQTLNEAGSIETTHKVDSKVRVYESSVGVSPSGNGIPDKDQEIIVSEGHSISVNSVGKEVLISRLEPLTQKDYKYWEMEVPAASTTTVIPAGVPIPPISSPNLPKPAVERPSDVETDPTFENLHHKE